MPVTYRITTALPVRVLADRRVSKLTDLAPLLDMSPTTVYRVLSQVRPPGPLFVERFLRAFPDTRLEEMFVVVHQPDETRYPPASCQPVAGRAATGADQ